MGRSIWIDDRETEETQDVLRSVYGEENVTVKRMKSGDIVAPGCQAAIERKEISDFLGSISDKRIWKQMRAMESQYEHVSIIVEGTHLEEWVADIYGGYASALRKVMGVCAYMNVNREGWSAFWVQSNGEEGTRMLGEYSECFFRQAEKADEYDDEAED